MQAETRDAQGAGQRVPPRLPPASAPSVLRAVAAAGHGLAATADLDVALAAVVERVGAAMAAASMRVYANDPIRRCLVPRAAWPWAAAATGRPELPWPMLDDAYGRLQLGRDAVARLPAGRDAGEHVLLAPILVGPELWGALALGSGAEARDWDDADRDVLSTVASLLAARIAAARAAEAQVAAVAATGLERERLLDGVIEAGRRLLAAPGDAAAIEQALQEIVRVMGVDRAVIFLHHDEPGGERVHRLAWEAVAPDVPRQSESPYVEFPDALIPAAVLAAITEGRVASLLVDDDPAPFMAAQRALGVRRLGVAPLLVDGAYSGCLSFDYRRDDRLPSAAQLRAIEAAGHAIAAALQQRSSLAREAERADRAARERIAQLEVANAALARSAEALTRADGLPKFMGTALSEAMSLSGAVSGVVMLHDPADDLLRQVVHRVRDRWFVIDAPGADDYSRPIPCADMPSWASMRADRRPVWFDHAAPGPMARPVSVAFHAAHGHRFVVHLPMLLDGAVIGLLGLAWDRSVSEPPAAARLELCYALAQQAALAQRQAALHARAHRAEVAEARAQEAREQAVKVERANDALRRAIAGLARIDNLDEFLADMLRESIRAAGARSGAVCIAKPRWVDHVVLIDGEGRLVDMDAAPDGIRHTPWTDAMRSFADQLLDADCEVEVDPLGEAVGVYREFHLAQGNRSVMLVPMRLPDRLVGWVGLGFAEPGLRAAAMPAMLRVLADQMTMAVELRRLADQAHAAAIAREREHAAERRAADLARINTALRDGVLATTHSTDLQACISAVASAARALMDADAVAVFSVDFENDLLSALRDGDTGWPSAIPLGELPELRQSLLDGRQLWLDADRRLAVGEASGDDRAGPAPSIAIAASLCVPVRIGEQPVGVLALSWRGPARVTPERRDLLSTLANQLALVLRLMQLAGQASEAAVLRDRERSARAAAAELAVANAALRAVNGRLGAGDDPAAVLREVLMETVRALGAVLGGVFEYEAAEACLVFRCLAAPGGPVAALEGHPLAIGDVGARWPIVDLRSWSRMTQSTEPVTLALADADPASLSDIQRWHVAQGHSLAAHIALMSAGEPIGMLALSFTGRTTLSASEAALLTALAQQAALALRMGRMARELEERARSKALLEERARLARDIHDGLAQGFTGILMQLGALEETTSLPASASTFVRRAADLARAGLDDARRSVMALNPERAGRGGLQRALRALADATTLPGRLQCDYEGFDGATGLDPAQEHDLFRIAQEAVANAVRHARARRIRLALSRDGRGLALRVEDDGVGFGPAPDGGGHGLDNMRARAAAIGARLEIDTAPGSGTRVRIAAGEGD